MFVYLTKIHFKGFNFVVILNFFDFVYLDIYLDFSHSKLLWNTIFKWLSTSISKTTSLFPNGLLYIPEIDYVEAKWCKFLANDSNSLRANCSYLYFNYSASSRSTLLNSSKNVSFFFFKKFKYSFLVAQFR